MKIKSFLPQPIIKRGFRAGLPMMKAKTDKYVEANFLFLISPVVALTFRSIRATGIMSKVDVEQATGYV